MAAGTLLTFVLVVPDWLGLGSGELWRKNATRCKENRVDRSGRELKESVVTVRGQSTALELRLARAIEVSVPRVLSWASPMGPASTSAYLL